MPMTFGTRKVSDPQRLAYDCAAWGVPVVPWYGRANQFHTSASREPGRGAVLMEWYDLKQLSRTADLDLRIFDDAGDVTLKRLTIERAEAVICGAPEDDGRVYLLELADRRLHLSRVPIDKAYNLKTADGSGYHAATTNAGTAWTWSGMVGNIWAVLQTAFADLGAVPAMPFTPHGTPENFDFYGRAAWDALWDVFDRLACVVDYDPTADVFTFQRIGTDPTADVSATSRLAAAVKVWEQDAQDGNRGSRPEKIRTIFRRMPAPSGGTSHYYTVDTTLTAVSGTVAGTYVQLFDDMVAIGSTGTPSNSAALASRAAERAADWLRKFTTRDQRIGKVYRDVKPDALIPVGATRSGAGFEDRGGGIRTELRSVSRYELERWRPTVEEFGAGAADFFPAEITGNDGAAEPSTKYSWKKLQLDSGTHLYVDASPSVTGSNNLKRLKYNSLGTVPLFVNGQQLWIRESPTDPGFYECGPHGSRKAISYVQSVTCSGGVLSGVAKTLHGPDLSAV